jgi:hypothetical protein
MKTSFFSRFLAFSLAFYGGSVAAVFVLTVVKTAVFFQHHFWSWLFRCIKGDVFPIALAELFRSPIMGLLFALLGTRRLAPSSTIKFGIACGAFSYAAAFFFSILGSTRGTLAQSVTSLNLIEYSLLGLPVGLVLLSRFFTARNIQA